jgi:carbon-monoxide dehydrogenase iron sulfur subunit
MSRTITINIESCLACKGCEIACALVHSKTKVLEQAVMESPSPQRMLTVEAIGEFAVPIQCRHCEAPLCLEICPTAAIYRASPESPVLINDDLCIGCKLCMIVCPFGIPQIHSEKRAIIKCDMCSERLEQGQDPACVEACPTKALKLVSLTEHIRTIRQKASQQFARIT